MSVIVPISDRRRWARPSHVWYSDFEVRPRPASSRGSGCGVFFLFGGVAPLARPPCRGLPWGARMGQARSWFSGSCWRQHAKTKKQAWTKRGVAFPPNKLRGWLARAVHSSSSPRLPQQRDTTPTIGRSKLQPAFSGLANHTRSPLVVHGEGHEHLRRPAIDLSFIP